MKAFRNIIWALVAIVLAGLAYLTWFDQQNGSNPMVFAQIGGPFDLIDQDGQPVDQTMFDGKPYALFFGFTHCPEICPTSLYEMAGWIEAMGPDAEKMGFAFISVDPERDTPEVLKDYVSAFSDRIVGLTGTQEQVDTTVKSYGVLAERVPLEDGDYTMNHTASVFLMNADGSFRGTIAYGEDADVVQKKLSNLIAVGS
jgi:protein SCO1/2